MMGRVGFRFKAGHLAFKKGLAETAMPDAKSLYQDDFIAWSKDQAAELRAAARGGSVDGVDWENLATEIEHFGVFQRTALRAQMGRVVRHLLKLEFSPAAGPRRGWVESIEDARSEIEELLETSPSLKRGLHAMVGDALRQGATLAVADLERYNELGHDSIARIEHRTYTEGQIVGDWFPLEAGRDE